MSTSGTPCGRDATPRRRTQPKQPSIPSRLPLLRSGTTKGLPHSKATLIAVQKWLPAQRSGTALCPESNESPWSLQRDSHATHSKRGTSDGTHVSGVAGITIYCEPVDSSRWLNRFTAAPRRQNESSRRCARCSGHSSSSCVIRHHVHQVHQDGHTKAAPHSTQKDVPSTCSRPHFAHTHVERVGS